jgi:hypothetical protein
MNGYLQNTILMDFLAAKNWVVPDILSAHTSLARSTNKRYLFILSLPIVENFKRHPIETFKKNSFVLSTRGRNLQKTCSGLSTHGRNLQKTCSGLSTRGRNLQKTCSGLSTRGRNLQKTCLRLSTTIYTG